MFYSYSQYFHAHCPVGLLMTCEQKCGIVGKWKKVQYTQNQCTGNNWKPLHDYNTQVSSLMYLVTHVQMFLFFSKNHLLSVRHVTVKCFLDLLRHCSNSQYANYFVSLDSFEGACAALYVRQMFAFLINVGYVL